MYLNDKIIELFGAQSMLFNQKSMRVPWKVMRV